MTLTLAFVALFLAYANGTNDNFKGVATLYGCGRLPLKAARGLGNLATLGGSLAALFFAHALLAKFGGKGLVPDSVSVQPAFALAVAAAAALTVLAATRFGFPVSTTHALVGALVGAGLLASNQGLNWGTLGQSFVEPLLLSPLLAVGAGLLVLPPLLKGARRLGLETDACLCVVPGAAVSVGPVLALDASGPGWVVASMDDCAPQRGTYLSAAGVRDGVHLFSAIAVSFARGLNDTPKIAALLILAGGLGLTVSLPLTAAAMLLGGWLAGRRVAETLAKRITPMGEMDAAGVNLITASIVLGASALGSPVSTTHVVCGALFGSGAVTGGARWRVIWGIVAAWVLTLPLAACIGMLGYHVFRALAGV